MIQRIVEAILRPVFALVATLMANLFLAPFKALFGGGRDEDEDERREIEPDEPEEQPDALEGEAPKQIEDGQR